MSKILVGMSLYDGLNPAPLIGVSRQLALIKGIWLPYATWIFGKTFYYSVFSAGSFCTLGFSRFLSKTLFRQFYSLESADKELDCGSKLKYSETTTKFDKITFFWRKIKKGDFVKFLWPSQKTSTLTLWISTTHTVTLICFGWKH